MPITLIAINQCADTALVSAALQPANAITAAIRDRAFELFQLRDGLSGGSDLSDWLHAERDVMTTPTAELRDSAKAFKASIALPGVDAEGVHVTAPPAAIVVQAASQRIYARIDLPAAVNVDRVTASLDKGILRLTAPKMPAPKMPAPKMAVKQRAASS